MNDSVRRYIPHSPGALLEWDPSQATGLAVVIAQDYDKLVARLAASEAEVARLRLALFKAEALLDSIWELEVPPNKLLEVIELWRQDRAALQSSEKGL